MIAIDTNIVVRFLTADDEKQAKAARKVIKEGDVFVATTVVLEIEWVLRAGYNFTPAAIADGLRAIAVNALAGVSNEDPAQAGRLRDTQAAGDRITELCK